jgi:hypothetical protein
MKKIILAAALMITAPAMADQCTGRVMERGGNIFLGEPHEEDICIFSDTKKALATCRIGDECKIIGATRECPDAVECVEVTHITKVQKR